MEKSARQTAVLQRAPGGQLRECTALPAGQGSAADMVLMPGTMLTERPAGPRNGGMLAIGFQRFTQCTCHGPWKGYSHCCSWLQQEQASQSNTDPDPVRTQMRVSSILNGNSPESSTIVQHETWGGSCVHTFR